MKRFYVSLSLLLLTALCLVSPVLADEASYYDAIEGWLTRAYTQGSSVYIEVRDTNKVLVDAGEIAGMDSNPQLIASNASTDAVSLSFDPSSAIAYIFYTTTGGLQLAAVTDIMSGGVQGPQISLSPASVSFGNVNVGSTSDRTVTVSNTGTADLILGTLGVTGTSFSRQGGTCAASGQTLAPAANCTIIVRFAPGSATTFNGNLSVPSNDTNVNVPLSGTGVSQAGNSDLIVQSYSLINCCDNGKTFTVSITVKNQGAGAAGPFKVKGYMSPDNNINLPPAGPPLGDTLLFTWSLSGLDAGATASNQISAKFSGYAIHQYYYLIFKADADDEVSETNETNNTKSSQFPLTR